MNIHIIHILNKLLFEPASFEFISELVYQTRSYFEKNDTHKDIIISILNFTLATDKIIIEAKKVNGDALIFNFSNSEDLINNIQNNWDKFKDHNEVELWYSYEIAYT